MQHGISRVRASAFTLVELIVVITILSILGTIGFIALQGYSVSARESTRLADLATLSKGLDSAIAERWSLPFPDGNYVTLMNSWALMGYQGYAWKLVSDYAKANEMTDPLDKNDFTYVTNASRNKYQVGAFFEKPETLAYAGVDGRISPWQLALSELPDLVERVSAASYSGRYFGSRGSELWVLFSNSGQPIQELMASAGAYDVLYHSGTTAISSLPSLTALFSKTNSLSWTGVTLSAPMYVAMSGVQSRYPGCNMPDIALPNGQVWAACNVGATVASTGSALIDSNWSVLAPQEVSTIGYYFQWGRNDILQIDTNSGANYSTSTQAAAANSVGHNLFISNSSNGSWMITADNNLWSWSWTDSTTGTYWSLGSPAKMQGPCAPKYHVPTLKEWNDAGLAIVGAKDTLSVSNTAAFANLLKLPYGGRRYYSPASFDGAWSIYWSSSPMRDAGYNGTSFYLSDSSNGANWGMIRCVAN